MVMNPFRYCFVLLDKDELDMIIFFFLKLFSAPLDNIKINFCLVQSCSSGEIFISLKGVRQAYPIICIRVNLS
jgi:hypothetical protein